MAQPGNYTPLSLYYSATASSTPLAANLVAGELALNTNDGKLFFKDSSGVVQVLASKAGSVNVSSFSGGTTGLTPNTATTGAVTLAGTLAVANGGTGVTTSTGSGNNVLSTSPTLVTPALGTPSALTLTNATGLPVGGITATGTPSSTTYLRGDGSWSTVSATPGGSTTQVQYNNAGAFAGSANFVFDGNNVGIGVTPSAFGSGFKALQMNGGSLMAYNGTNMYYLNNTYFDGANYKYVNNGFATNYTQTSGTHAWATAPSGTAGNTVTFTEAMRITSAGNVGIGSTGPVSKLEVVNSGVATLYIGYNNTSFNYLDADNNVFRNSAGTERMRIDSSGNVGIGTSSPSSKLDIVVASGTSNVLQLRGSATAASYLYQNNNGGVFSVGIDNSTGTTFGNAAYSANFYHSGAYPMLFWTSGAERMRIDSSGNLLVGQTTQVNQERIGFTTTTDVGLYCSRTNNSACYFASFNTSSGLAGYIYSTGVATTYNSVSDYRLKENVAPITGALNKISALKPVNYTWKTDGSNGQGFIAHELAEVFPDAVVGKKDDVNEDGTPKYQGIDTSLLVATLTAAIQEQQAMIEELKAKVAALEAK